MPGSINPNLTNFVQSISRLTNSQNSDRITQSSLTNKSQVNLRESRQLSAEIALAIETVKTSQTTITQAQTAIQSLEEIESGLTELRNIATSAANPNLGVEDRQALVEHFNALQTEINASTDNQSIQGGNL